MLISRLIPFFLFLLLSYKGSSQTLSLPDLERLLFISSDKFDSYLYEKGYELHKVKKNEFNTQNITYKYSPVNKEPEYLAKNIFSDGDILLTYNIFNTKDYLSFKNTIEKNGYIYFEQKYEDDRMITEYKRNKFLLKIYTIKVNNSNESYVAHEINLIHVKP